VNFPISPLAHSSRSASIHRFDAVYIVVALLLALTVEFIKPHFEVKQRKQRHHHHSPFIIHHVKHHCIIISPHRGPTGDHCSEAASNTGGGSILILSNITIAVTITCPTTCWCRWYLLLHLRGLSLLEKKSKESSSSFSLEFFEFAIAISTITATTTTTSVFVDTHNAGSHCRGRGGQCIATTWRTIND
jgi:hypothetical protein